MKVKLIFLEIVVLIVMATSYSYAGSFGSIIGSIEDEELEKGLKAYEQKHYDDAYIILKIKATWEGNQQAQFIVGEMFYYGYGVTQSYQRAKKWYVMAANGDHAQAQFKLAELYMEHTIAPKHEREIVFWYLSAAQNGIAKAQSQMGTLYHHGFLQFGIHQNIDKAKYWYQKAALQGNEFAKEELEVIADYDVAELESIKKYNAYYYSED